MPHSSIHRCAHLHKNLLCCSKSRRQGKTSRCDALLRFTVRFWQYIDGIIPKQKYARTNARQIMGTLNPFIGWINCSKARRLTCVPGCRLAALTVNVSVEPRETYKCASRHTPPPSSSQYRRQSAFAGYSEPAVVPPSHVYGGVGSTNSAQREGADSFVRLRKTCPIEIAR